MVVALAISGESHESNSFCIGADHGVKFLNSIAQCLWCSAAKDKVGGFISGRIPMGVECKNSVV